jgi:hypothetical protein
MYQSSGSSLEPLDPGVDKLERAQIAAMHLDQRDPLSSKTWR